MWIDSWQMQCCGEPFRVGGRVEFSTTPVVDREFLGTVLGEERAATVTDYEDHHDLDDGPMSALVGRVEYIEAISCRYERWDRTLLPVPGTTKAVRLDEATGWEPEDEEIRFVGYVVALQPE